MKKNISILALLAFLMPSVSMAQLKLPQPSPKAETSQMIGLTEVKVTYSRPAVKGRKVWGDLVPLGKVWRTGANSATEMKFSHDVEIAGKNVKAGEYALFTIPNESEWTIILNTNEGQKGSTEYKESLDYLRFSAKVSKSGEFKERFTISIDPVSDELGTVCLSWENIKVCFDIKTFPLKAAEKNIADFAAGTGNLWYDLAQATRYSIDNDINKDKTMVWIDQSISLKDHFFNKYIKAKALYKAGQKEEAMKWVKLAKEYGEKNPSGFYNAYKQEIEKALTEWK
jgi:hypothetical protein